MLIISVKRMLTATLFILSLLAPPLPAQGTIRPHLEELEGYRLEKLADSPTSQEDVDSPLGTEVMDDYILFDYSRWTVRATDSSSPALELEVYEMQDPQGTFGVFSNWNHRYPDFPSQRLGLSVDNYYVNESLIFWRGTYFFHLRAAGQDAVDSEVLEGFARALVDVLPVLNLHPLTVIHLPQENLIQESVRFYLGEASFSLDRKFPRDLIGPLGFEQHIEVTSARYSPENHALYLVGYPTASLAADHSAKLQDAMESYFSPEGVYMRRSGVIVSIFFGPESEARETLTRIQYAPTIKWIYQKEQDPEELVRQTMTFLDSVRRTLVVILVFLPVVLGTGLVAGLIRYRLLQSFPAVWDQGETIHLDI